MSKYEKVSHPKFKVGRYKADPATGKRVIDDVQSFDFEQRADGSPTSATVRAMTSIFQSIMKMGGCVEVILEDGGLRTRINKADALDRWRDEMIFRLDADRRGAPETFGDKAAKMRLAAMKDIADVEKPWQKGLPCEQLLTDRTFEIISKLENEFIWWENCHGAE